MAKIVTGKELKQYLMEHLDPTSLEVNDQWDWNNTSHIHEVVKPLYVFKKVNSGIWWDHAIANLIIPVGALVYVPCTAFLSGNSDYRKMRCSKAFVHSMAICKVTTTVDRRRKSIPTVGTQIKHVYSQHLLSFKYRVGRNVRPAKPFCVGFGQCESGIHFFLNLEDALRY